MNAHASTQDRRLKLAELTSSLGAGVLGLGIGVLVADYLRGIGLALLIVGLVTHAWGMTDKHRIEDAVGATRPGWSTALYWICWIALAAIAVYAIARVI